MNPAQLAVTAVFVMMGCMAFAGMVAALVVDVVTTTQRERQRHQLNHEADQLWAADWWLLSPPPVSSCVLCDSQLAGTGTLTHHADGSHTWSPTQDGSAWRGLRDTEHNAQAGAPDS